MTTNTNGLITKIAEGVSALLVPNWKLVMAKSWSIWLILLAGLLSGLELAMPHLPVDLDIPNNTLATASVAISALAYMARLLAQRALSPSNPDEAGGTKNEPQA